MLTHDRGRAELLLNKARESVAAEAPPTGVTDHVYKGTFFYGTPVRAWVANHENLTWGAACALMVLICVGLPVATYHTNPERPGWIVGVVTLFAIVLVALGAAQLMAWAEAAARRVYLHDTEYALNRINDALECVTQQSQASPLAAVLAAPLKALRVDIIEAVLSIEELENRRDTARRLGRPTAPTDLTEGQWTDADQIALERAALSELTSLALMSTWVLAELGAAPIPVPPVPTGRPEADVSAILTTAIAG